MNSLRSALTAAPTSQKNSNYPGHKGNKQNELAPTTEAHSSWRPPLILFITSAGRALCSALEHFRIYCRPLKQSLNHAFALSAVMSFKESAIVCSRASLVLAWAERSNCLSFAQAFSMGFRSGE